MIASCVACVQPPLEVRGGCTQATSCAVCTLIEIGNTTASRDFVAHGRPLRGQKRLAPLAKRSTCNKSKLPVVNEIGLDMSI